MPDSLNKQLIRLVNRYEREGGDSTFQLRDVARWAIKSNLWAQHPSDVVDQCAKQLARAMREELMTDPQGRSVRAKHAARTRQGDVQAVFWADIRTAPRGHMEIALKQRRNQVVGDCRQLKTDVDSFNENRSPMDPIQMSFDFTADLAELEAVDRPAVGPELEREPEIVPV